MEIDHRLEQIEHDLLMDFGADPGTLKVYGVPRGGMLAALWHHKHWIVVRQPEEADAILDDIIQSGKVFGEFLTRFPEKPFHAIVDKRTDPRTQTGEWVLFPWEDEDKALEDIAIYERQRAK